MKRIPMTEIKRRHLEACPDSHWFDKDTMRFFRTELPQYGFEFDRGALFVTGETDFSGNLAFSVRRLYWSGCIETIGRFHAYPTKRAAGAALRKMARTGMVDNHS